MKTLFALTLATFALMSSIAFADELPHQGTDTLWMYVLVGDNGKIVKAKDTYLLVLDRDNLTSLRFTDRPVRLTKHVTAQELKDNWKIGLNDFQDDHPNAAVVVSGKTQTVQLASMNITSDTVEFELLPDGNNAIATVEEGATVAFIDATILNHELGHNIGFE